MKDSLGEIANTGGDEQKISKYKTALLRNLEPWSVWICLVQCEIKEEILKCYSDVFNLK